MDLNIFQCQMSHRSLQHRFALFENRFVAFLAEANHRRPVPYHAELTPPLCLMSGQRKSACLFFLVDPSSLESVPDTENTGLQSETLLCLIRDEMETPILWLKTWRVKTQWWKHTKGHRVPPWPPGTLIHSPFVISAVLLPQLIILS